MSGDPTVAWIRATCCRRRTLKNTFLMLVLSWCSIFVDVLQCLGFVVSFCCFKMCVLISFSSNDFFRRWLLLFSFRMQYVHCCDGDLGLFRCLWCPRSVAWESPGHTLLSLRSPTWGHTFRHSSANKKGRSTNRWPVWGVRYRNGYTKVRRALGSLQRVEAPDVTQLRRPHNPPQGDQVWDWHEWNSEEAWSGTVNLKVEPAHGPRGIGAPGSNTGTSPHHSTDNAYRTTVVKTRHLCSWSLCSRGSFYKKVV